MADSIFHPNMTFGDLVLLIISIFVLVAGILSVFFILRGGVLLILSGGKDDKIKPAINTIRYSVLGIIVTVATIFIFPILGKLLGLDVEKYAKPQRIFEKIEDIGNNIFGGSSNSYSNSSNMSNSSLPDNFSSDL